MLHRKVSIFSIFVDIFGLLYSCSHQGLLYTATAKMLIIHASVGSYHH